MLAFECKWKFQQTKARERKSEVEREEEEENYKKKHCLPDSIDASAATIKEIIAPGPATFLATRPATTYIPVPTQLPTPREIKSNVESIRLRFPSSALPFSPVSSSMLDWDWIVLVRKSRPLNRSTSSRDGMSGMDIFSILEESRSGRILNQVRSTFSG